MVSHYGCVKMAYTVELDYGSHVDIGTKLQALLNGATITTLHSSGILKMSADHFICFIVYE